MKNDDASSKFSFFFFKSQGRGFPHSVISWIIRSDINKKNNLRLACSTGRFEPSEAKAAFARSVNPHNLLTPEGSAVKRQVQQIINTCKCLSSICPIFVNDESPFLTNLYENKLQ